MTKRCRRRARIVSGICVSVLTWGATLAFAQAPPPHQTRAYVDPIRGQSVDDLVALALRQSPDASAARARVDIARGELDQAGRRPNPSLSFERREEVGGTDHQTAIGLAIPLDLFRRAGRTDAAARGVEAATAAAADRERLVAISVRVRTARLLAAVHHLDVREAIAAASRQTAELIAARVEAGSAPAVDRDAARIEAQMAEVEVRRERVDVESMAAALRQAVGLAPGDPLVLRQSLEDLAAPAGAAPARHDLSAGDIQTAVNARPDLRQADAEIARETARQDVLRREARVDVSIVGSYMQMASSFPQLGLTPTGSIVPIRGTFDMVAVGATITLPWRNRNQGAIAAAGGAIDAARSEREARRLTALNDINALQHREQEAREAVGLFTGGLRDLASRNVEVLRESYQLGRATLLDVLTETRRYLDVETAYASALLELIEARVALAGALGETR